MSAVVSDLSKEELMVMVIAEIINELIVANKDGRDVDLNK